MKKQNILSLLKFAELLVNARLAYNQIKDDEEAKKTADMFGKRSLVYYFVFLGLGVLAGLLIYWSVTHFVSTLILVAIFGFVISLYMALYALGFYILSFNLAIKQRKLNKKAVGMVAFVLNILVIVAAVVGILIAVLVSL